MESRDSSYEILKNTQITQVKKECVFVILVD